MRAGEVAGAAAHVDDAGARRRGLQLLERGRAEQLGLRARHQRAVRRTAARGPETSAPGSSCRDVDVSGRRPDVDRSLESVFLILPVVVFGSSGTISTYFGTMKLSSRAWHSRWMSFVGRASTPGSSTTNAFTAWPRISSGTPMTAASLTPVMLIERVLDLLRRDLLAARLDDVVHAADEVEVALVVEPAEVAGVEHHARRAAARA